MFSLNRLSTIRVINVPELVSIGALRAQIARLEGHWPAASAEREPRLTFGQPDIDEAIPGHGLMVGALHEFIGAGADTEFGAFPAQLIAALAGRLPGPVLWIVDRTLPFAAGLAGCGLCPDRIIFAQAGKAVLGVMEDGLRHGGLAAVVGEVSGRFSLTTSRRLQLAAEGAGVTAFALRRSQIHDDPALREPSAALTRWRIVATLSPPPIPSAPEVPGLSRPRWRLELQRARGGLPRTWLVDAPGHDGQLDVVAQRSAAASPQQHQPFHTSRHAQVA
ncbi:damage-inducible mutagenesis protein (plasmid) [Lichenicola cladoniae]|uniref:Damage-inducible mutagenesis protein n=1 Tax=Lichenicola cladoniae TaxID=1484109 RepID=A0A6M8HXT7_9PROT|nr:damage-inducible mutagenesis protein [Lichenicola cladoniae]NPD66308.1 damage-inducible mutagenesis protein [Acetobacteraceae bacterium]QKE93158.1 damage-inducible mutagenesis protein [Lichenicola cladoniae]